jgi:GNAT superfamily N-acetyltransferase
MEPIDGVGELVLLQDARQVRIRPVRGDDADALIAMHEHLSPRTVRRRFFASMPHLSPEMARIFTGVDGTTRVALVAVDETGGLVAVGRFDILADPGAAEVAVVVLDDYQHHGLGVLLLERLIVIARDHGVDHFVADVLAENRPMLAAFRDAGLMYTSERDGSEIHLTLPLPPPAAHPR